MSVAILRDQVEEDKNFVISSWLKSFEKSRDLFCGSKISRDAYYRGHHKVVSSLLCRATMVVACNPADQSQIFGWVCYERIDERSTVLHYLYVKAPFRGVGIGRQLFERATDGSDKIIATHWTKRLADDRAGEKHGVAFDNYYLWRRDDEPINGAA